MLKRFFLLILTVLYLFTTSGFALNLHYCGKLLTGFEINAPAKSCVKIAKLKCCKDKQIKVKVKDAHQVSDFAFQAKNKIVSLPRQAAYIELASPVKHIHTACFNKAPPGPLTPDIPAFIQNCSFRI